MLIPALQGLEAELRDIVQSELKAGERLAWASQPIPRYFTVATILPMLFAIPWTAFAIFWTAMAYMGTRKIGDHGAAAASFKYLFPLFGVPFILIGLGMLSSPVWMVRRLKRTVYAITDQRAIIFTPGWFGSRKVQSFAPEALASMERTERRDGSGDLVFEQYTQRRGSSSQTIRNGFLGVPNVREVEDLLRSTLIRDRARSLPPG